MGVVDTALRGVQFLWTLLIMALSGNMIAMSNGHTPSIINYAMFVAVFAMLSLIYLIPTSIKESFAIHPIINIVLDVLNTLFFFCGGVALAAELGAHSCSNNSYTKGNSITQSGTSPSSQCREAQATTAFLWFGFVAFAVSTVLSGLSGKRGK